MPTEQHPPPATGPDLLRHLLDRTILHPEDWDALDPTERDRLTATEGPEALLADLVAAKLLTPYQASRITSGSADDLVLGNYRLLARLGVGSLGTLYQAEHLLLRRPVAVQLLAGPPAPRALRRLWACARAVARLQHPHLVAALDLGEAPGPRPYLVTEFVSGQDVADLVQSAGPFDLTRAGLLVYQIADALAEAHRQGLVHRDLKPANVVLTADGQAKLLDFGLTLELDPSSPYRAPELTDDSCGGDERADLFSLGGLLYWCLTGREPLRARRPLILTEHRPDLPRDLDAVLARLLAPPAERYPTATAVMRALRPFLPADEADWHYTRPAPPPDQPAPATVVAATPANRVLIVDDTDELRHFCRAILTAEGLHCVEAATGQAAMLLFQSQTVDLVLLDLQLPDHTGMEILQKMRQAPRCANLKVIVCSGAVRPDEMAQLLLAGADYYLTKPFSLVQLQSCVRAVLRLKDAQDRADLLTNRLLCANAELEFALRGRDGDLLKARNALVLALAKLVEQRSTETGAHLMRLQRFCRVLAETASEAPSLSGQLDAAFIDLLEVSVPLHDIGKVALPDYILNKPGKLDPDEHRLMQAHTVIGAETLADVARQHGFALPFLQIAIDIARHHHERFDGTGYPDRLAGTAIPLAARIVALADVYDALRARRVYKPALSHATVVHTMIEGSPGHFDPVLVQSFQRCAPRFERIFRELVD